MEREKQIIEEMAKTILKGELDRNRGDLDITEFSVDLIVKVGMQRVAGATALYNAGYRKERQGEWIRRENKSPTQIEAYCSMCGRDAVYQVIDNRWQFENYCPHCGARMKGAE